MNFIDTMKFYQLPLSSLAKSAHKNKIANIIIINLAKSSLKETQCLQFSAFNSLLDQNKTWDYFSGRKGVIPYKLINSHEDLDTKPEGEFFSRTEVYSSLKN